MPSKPFYPWFPADFWMKTNHLTIEQRGFYRDFLDHCWVNDGWLSPEQFREILKLTPKKFEKLWEKIVKFLQKNDQNKKYSQKKLIKIFSDVEEKSAINKRNADIRWKNQKGGNAFASVSHSDRNANQNQIQNHKKDLPAKSRKPDPIWDAVCQIWGFDPKTKTEQSRIGKIAKEIKLKLSPGVIILDEIKARKAAYIKRMPGMNSGPEAVLKYWDEFKPVEKSQSRKYVQPVVKPEDMPDEKWLTDFKKGAKSKGIG